MSAEDVVTIREYLQRYVGTLIDRDKVIAVYMQATGADYQTVYDQLSQSSTNLVTIQV